MNRPAIERTLAWCFVALILVYSFTAGAICQSVKEANS
jgi:hypothetical protein